jgi:hypothetical protein
MFFRRERPKQLTFDERLQAAEKLGFKVELEGEGRALLTRQGCGAIVRDAGEKPEIGKAGIMIGGQIGRLIDAGYQKFYEADGRRVPALATHLTALHAFEEDLREALGLTSLYNESLGTVNDAHLYDRVRGRDRGGMTRPWDQRTRT